MAPPLVAAAAGATGIAAAVELARGHMILAALLVQLKTVLDNADGQLARLSGRITVFGRYLDSELDLFVNAALFAAVGWSTGRPILAIAGFLALTTVLSVNYNVERLYRAERGADALAMPEATGRADAVAARPLPDAVRAAGPTRRRFRRSAAPRCRPGGASSPITTERRSAVLANLGMSTQLAVFGLCIALGQPLAFAWIALAELGLVALLALRRELVIHVPHLKEETL